MSSDSRNHLAFFKGKAICSLLQRCRCAASYVPNRSPSEHPCLWLRRVCSQLHRQPVWPRHRLEDGPPSVDNAAHVEAEVDEKGHLDVEGLAEHAQELEVAETRN